MASLFQKFQQSIKTLTKNKIFTKDPRNLQFEADINRLFLYTSYNRLGEKAEEKDAEEIIQLAIQSSVSSQTDQVHENIHSQFNSICGALDRVLLLPPDESDSDTGSVENHTRKSGLGLAVGKKVASSNEDILRTRPLTPQQLSESLKSQIGYTLEIKPSQIPHKDSGQGLFLSGQAPIGSLIAFYPGVIYSPAFYNYIPNYPKIDMNNPYLISRYDGTVIDAKAWGNGGANREFWDGYYNSSNKENSNSNGDGISGSDRMWKVVSNPLKANNNMMKSKELIERRNPLAFAHFANHPSKGISPNVMLCPYDFPLNEKNMRVYLPNVVFGGDEVASMRRFGTVWFKSWGARKEGKLGFVRGLVLVATRVLEDEEVFLNYRLSNVKRRPEWYVPVDLDEDKRRWS